MNSISKTNWTEIILVHICHGPAGVPWPATRCLCVLSTWLVVCCWCPRALLSIVCPLSSCYPIIVSVALPVSPLFVSLFSLLVSVVLCWSVVLCRVCMLKVTALCLSFSLRGGFCSSSFYFIIKKTHLPAFESSPSSLQSIPDIY